MPRPDAVSSSTELASPPRSWYVAGVRPRRLYATRNSKYRGAADDAERHQEPCRPALVPSNQRRHAADGTGGMYYLLLALGLSGQSLFHPRISTISVSAGGVMRTGQLGTSAPDPARRLAPGDGPGDCRPVPVHLVPHQNADRIEPNSAPMFEPITIPCALICGVIARRRPAQATGFDTWVQASCSTKWAATPRGPSSISSQLRRHTAAFLHRAEVRRHRHRLRKRVKIDPPAHVVHDAVLYAAAGTGNPADARGHHGFR